MYSIRNSTCFLCLRGILCAVNKEENIDRQNSSSHPNLSTNGEKQLPPTPPQGKIGLRSICRHLGVNVERILTSFGKGDAQALLEETGQDCSMTFCRLCSKRIESLSKLCMELELLQMKVNYFLKSVCVVLEHSEANEKGTPPFSHLITNQEMKESHQQFAKLLRREIKRKCEIKLSQTVPKVRLTKESSAQLNKKIQTLTCAPQWKDIGNASIDGTPCASPLVSQNCEDDSSDADGTDSPPPERTPKPRYGASMLSKYKPCRLCVPPQMVTRSSENHHKILHHLETCFISSKRADLPMDQFKKYCEHVVKVELLSSVKVHHAKGDHPRFSCSNCSRVSALHGLRYHVCSKHKDIIIRKLVELQRNTTIDELEAIQLPPLARPRRNVLTCNVCSQTFPYFQSLAKHKKLVHEKGIPRGTTLNCDLCEKTFQSAGGLVSHQNKKHGRKGRKNKKNPTSGPCNLCDPPQMVRPYCQKEHEIVHHLETWFVSSKQAHLTMTEFKRYCEHVVQVELLSSTKLFNANGTRKGKRRCPYCPYASDRMYLMRQHVCLKHTGVISEKVVELQGSTPINELGDDVRLFSPRWSRLHPESRVWKCDVCDTIFRWRRNLLHHKRKKHGEAITKRNRSPNTLSSNFKCEFCGAKYMHARHLLAHQRLKHSKLLRGFKCNICHSVFQRSYGLERHWKAAHALEVERQQTISNENVKPKEEESESALQNCASPVESQLKDPLEISNEFFDESDAFSEKSYAANQDDDDCNEMEEQANPLNQCDVVLGYSNANQVDLEVEMKVFPDE